MTAKDKALAVVQKYGWLGTKWEQTNFYTLEKENAKQCAIICVDELIEQNGELYLNGIGTDYYKKVNSYLFDLKKEIEAL